MKLSNFEEFIDETILNRGYNYFVEDRILSINEIKEGHFRAVVEGSDDYIVEVWLGREGKIIDINCDCPYDWGEFCKHQAAVLYALKDKGALTNNLKSREIKKAKESPKQDLNTILVKLSKDQLIDIILNMSEQYPELEKQLLFRYITGSEEVAICKKLIREYISRAKNRGFIEWNKAGYAMEGAWQVLDKSRIKLECGDIIGAVQLCITVLSIVVDVLQYCDESGGEVGSVIDEAIEIINEAAGLNLKELGPVKQKKLFLTIFKEALDERYEGWSDWKFGLLRSCTNFCGISEHRAMLEKELNKSLKVTSINDYGKYNISRIKLLQLEIIERFDDLEKAEEFVQANIKFNEFREKAVIKALDEGKYEKALRFCLEGDEIDQAYAGLVNKWQKYRYLAYEKLGDIENQRKIATEILFQNELAYYIKLKKLYQPDEWQTVLENIISIFEKQAYKQPVYVQILIEENLTLQLLEYCRQNITQVENLYHHLIDKHYEEVNKIFINYIKQEAVMASDRKKYKKVCAKIKTYKKVFGNILADEIISDLKQDQCRKTAFLDELSKIK